MLRHLSSAFGQPQHKDQRAAFLDSGHSIGAHSRVVDARYLCMVRCVDVLVVFLITTNYSALPFVIPFNSTDGRTKSTLHYFIFVDYFQIRLHFWFLKITNFNFTRFRLCRINCFFHCTTRLLHVVKDRYRARGRGPHHTDQSEKITSFGPFRINHRHRPNYVTLFVPTSINYELHKIALHFLTR